MIKIFPLQFFREIRSEVKRVTWPAQKEIITTSIMVFIMTIIFSLFFVLTDSFISNLIRLVFNTGSAFYDF